MTKRGASIILLLLAWFSCLPAYAQIKGKPGRGGRTLNDRGRVSAGRPVPADSLGKGEKVRLKTFPASRYKYVYPDRWTDTLTVDTLLTPYHRLRLNFTEQDWFLFMPFQNMGQPLNALACRKIDPADLRAWVPEGKRPDFRKASDIPFYHSPTPYSRLFYLSGNKQGQMLDSRIGIRVSPRFYVGTGYKGLSSLGYYQHGISSHENWYVHGEYTWYHGRARTRFYLVKNHLENEENGGIADEKFFESPGSEYLDRGKIPVRLDDKSIWHSRQMRWDQTWQLFPKRPAWVAEASYNYLKGYYRYEGNETSVFGPLIPDAPSADSMAVKYRTFDISLHYTGKHWTWTQGFRRYRVDLAFDERFYADSSGRSLPLRTDYRAVWTSVAMHRNRWNADADIWYEMRTSQRKIRGRVFYGFPRDTLGMAVAYDYLEPPVYYRLWQSRFAVFRWNIPFSPSARVETSIFYAGRAGNLRLENLLIRRPVYFAPDSLPARYEGNLSVQSITYARLWKWRKWGMLTRLRWQHVRDNPALDLPRWNLQMMLFYGDKWFKQHMKVQAGILWRYFSAFYLSGFNPLTQSFFRQNRKLYGNFYLADVFWDFKVKRFRAFLAVEHVNAVWERLSPRYYSAPFYPYADYVFRLGIIWEFIN